MINVHAEGLRVWEARGADELGPIPLWPHSTLDIQALKPKQQTTKSRMLRSGLGVLGAEASPKP